MKKVSTILQKDDTLIQLIRTVNTDNQPIYVYLMLGARQWEILNLRLKREDVDLSREGTILAYGFGHEPDDVTKETIRKITDVLSATASASS